MACAGGGTGQTSSDTVLVLDTGRNIGTNGAANDQAAAGGVLFESEDATRHLGVPTTGTIDDPKHYETAEFYNGGVWVGPLAATHFSDAYARGWTGKGSLITIADTGVDLDHSDLAANIGFTKDFSGTGIEDNNGHGTHVAGIEGAIRNNIGTHGAAFDATLAIGKVTNNRSYSFSTAAAVAEWGRDLGSVAVNVSAAYGRDAFLDGRLVQIDVGNYYLDHSSYGTNGFYNARSAAYGWKAALGPEQVLIKAAGNDGTTYSAGFNQMATATDDSGELILGGQMLVVGNWDATSQRIVGNQAGNVCVTWTNGACRDAARISDVFIMAPGTDIYAPYRYGSYAYLTGTSMAAPMVAGAIGVLHQMWPHMKGRHLAQLLLQTANADIYGYNPHIHGRGLLDMDRATQPVGATGLPVTGRTNGDVVALSGGVSGAGIDPSVAVTLANIMVLDAYERDFYIDLGNGFVPQDTRKGSLTEAGHLYNAYAPYFDDKQHVAHTQMIGTNALLRVGAGTSANNYFGHSVSGVFGQIRQSNSGYMTVDYSRPFGPLRLSGQIGKGITLLDVDTKGSLLTGTAPIHTSSAAIVAEGDIGNATIGVSIQRPVSVDKAKFRYRLPVDRTLAGDVVHSQRDINFKNHRPEIDYGVFLKGWQANGAFQWKLFTELRTNIAGEELGKEVRFGAKLSLRL